MTTGRKRSALSYIPGYTNNAVLQLIIFLGVAFVALGLVWAVFKLIYQGDDTNFYRYIIATVALPSVHNFGHYWWTVLTYGWFHFSGFFEMLSNMLWLYCFGSVVQMLVGHRQVIPLYAYSLVAGGVFYLLGQLLPGALGVCPFNVLGSHAGLMGLAAASVALTPQYRFYLTETFSIPLLLVAGIFTFLMLMSSGLYLPVILMLVAGGLTGFGYVRLLKAGYRPGEWMYSLTGSIAATVTPNETIFRKKQGKNSSILHKIYEPKAGISQQRIDDILDKINQRGYNSLSSEEKDILMRAGKE